MNFLVWLTMLYIAYLLYTINDSIVTFGENFNEVVIDQLEKEIKEPEVTVDFPGSVKSESVQDTLARHRGESRG
jgi:hypothetical protein